MSYLDYCLTTCVRGIAETVEDRTSTKMTTWLMDALPVKN
jgi:hypothetical protein